MNPVPMISVGAYQGQLTPSLNQTALIEALAQLPARIAASQERSSAGRNQMTILSLPMGKTQLKVAVKSFGPQSAWKDWMDHRRGSKAQRSWEAARALQAAGAGTPPPIAFLERWQESHLQESHFITEYQEGITSFRDELNRLYREDPICAKIMTLLERVADAVWALHEAGVIHFDLGNQNILLRRHGEQDWKDVQFIDLNRARVRPPLSLRERARDISRIDLPSDFLRVFKVMYFQEQNPPPEFERWEDRYRQRFAWHTRTRAWRHPLRMRRQKILDALQTPVPHGRDLWIWDDRSGQAISTLLKRERKQYMPLSNVLHIAQSLPQAAPIRRAYKRLMAQTFKTELSLAGRIGMTLEPSPDTADKELRLLNELGPVPVLLRFYHHQTKAQWEYGINLVRRLKQAGHAPSIALIQDRQAVLQPGRWQRFASTVLDALHSEIEWVEVGHAFNRVKWGLWAFEEYVQLLRPVAEIAAKHPGLKLMGPAGIDFEYHYLPALLSRLPQGFRFNALSHLLYVDRRGAPENRQGPFSLVEKCALARSIAETSHACEPRLVLSEVNWPLLGTGVYSPVNSPYETPGPRRNDPSVSEEEYGQFMIRYLALALCSGMVERVYWWRLVARGFGLVDDTDPAAWRLRPAYIMLKAFLAHLGDSTFIRKWPTPEGQHILLFRDRQDQSIALAWSVTGHQPLPADLSVQKVFDALGRPMAPQKIPLLTTPSPIYAHLE